MKPHKVEHYRSVLDAASETGCQLCRYMRNYQAKCIQGDLDPAPKSICNFHAWSLAAVHDRMDASRVFLYLLSSQSLGVEAECEICLRVEEETAAQLQLLASTFTKVPAEMRLNLKGELCLPHARQLCKRLPAAYVSAIEAALEQYRKGLVMALRSQQRNDFDSSGWGILGHVAEFLTGQRGLYR